MTPKYIRRPRGAALPPAGITARLNLKHVVPELINALVIGNSPKEVCIRFLTPLSRFSSASPSARLVAHTSYHFGGGSLVGVKTSIFYAGQNDEASRCCHPRVQVPQGLPIVTGVTRV